MTEKVAAAGHCHWSLKSALMALFAWGAAAGVPALGQTGEGLEAVRLRALELVNQSRLEHDLPPLALEDKLNHSAQAHADDMFTRHYYGHASPEGRTADDRYVEAGGSKWRLTAENIAHCGGCRPPPRVSIADRLHRWWMESPSHRANILNRGLTHFGYGMAVNDERQLYAVQTFAGPGLPRGLQPDDQLAPLSLDDQAQQALREFNLVRQQSGRAPIESSIALVSAAQAILPEHDLEEFDLAKQRNFQDALPPSLRRRWQSISVFAATCGGCGAVPTAADVRYFAQQWLEDPSYRRTLLDPRLAEVGFIIASNGEGMKVALAVLGLGR